MFGLLNLPSVQESVKERIVEELKSKLNTDLGIDKLHFQPFNTVELNGIYLNDRDSNKILIAEKLYANISLYPLLHKEIVINTVYLTNFEVDLSKESKDSPLNIQFIIDAFKPTDNTPKQKFEVKVNSLNISGGCFRYDVKDQLYKQNIFDQNHIEVTDLNANLALKSLVQDSLNIHIKRLSLKEKSGVEIRNLITRIISHENLLEVRGFNLELPRSLLKLDRFKVDFADVRKSNKLNEAIIDCKIGSSYITPKDVSAFTPIFRNFVDRLFFKAELSGTINDLIVSDLVLDYGDKINLLANAGLKNIQNGDSLYIKGNVERLEAKTEGINGLLSNFSGEDKVVPKEIKNLGTVLFTGNINGFLNSLKAYGVLTTQLGVVKTDVIFGFNPIYGLESFVKGDIYTSDFRLGELLDNKDLDKLSFDLLVDLQKPKNKKLGGKIEGKIDLFDYKGYSYENITLNGQYDGLKIEGEASVDDENVFLNINGLFDLSKEQPELDFNAKLRNFRPDKLNLSQKYDNSYLSLSLDANFKGNNIDDVDGLIQVDSIHFIRNGETLDIEKFKIEASGTHQDRKLIVTSDFINGKVLGAYSFSTLINSFKRTFNSYLPALVSINELNSKEIKENDLTLDFTIGNTEKISSMLSLPFVAYSDVKLSGYYNNKTENFQIEAFYPSVKIAGMVVKSGYFLLENSNKHIKSNITGIITGKNNVQNNVIVNLDASNNTVNSQVNFTNNSKKKFKGDFITSTSFFRDSKTSELSTNVNVRASDIVLNDTLWKLSDAKVLLKPNKLIVENFNIRNSFNDQYVNIDGTYSTKYTEDVIHVDLKNINLDYVFNTLAIDALNFSGFATGRLDGFSIGGNPYFNVGLDIRDFGFNNALLGNLNLTSNLDVENQKINIGGTILNDENRKTNINGFIKPMTQELSIDFDADKVNIAFLNKYASSLFNNISGKGTGKVRLYGDFSDVTVAGKAFIENGSLGINFLNTTYAFTDTIYLKEDLIYFNNIKFTDQYNNEAKISGKVVHDYFSNFMYYVDLVGNNFLLYNATESLNPTLYGKVLASGHGSISGDEKAVNINAQLRSNEGTRISMNFMEDTVNEYSFITYKDSKKQSLDKDSTTQKEKQLMSNTLKTDSGMEVNMNFYVDATPEAVVEIIMDPVGGDVLRCSGTGALQFVWGSKIDPKLYGTYVIDNGSYNFTFQKIIERKFQIQSGSTVLFRGDPFQANLGVNAMYKLNANLYDLDSNLAQNAGQTTVPVECLLKITGELRHPNIGLDVALPAADPEVQRQVKSLMNNEDMVNRQMVYLLLLSKFYTPNNTNDENKSSDFASLASATLSTQLSKVLSTIDDRWQFGTNIRTSDTGLTRTEVELLLSSQLLNNRVLLNGNFGYRDDPNTTAAFISDVDVEVLLNRPGTWRVKAYNHYNEKYYYIGSGKSVQTQGVGIMYKRNFDYLKEIFGLQSPYVRAKKDTTSLPDSTSRGSKLGEFIRIKEKNK